MWGKRVNMRMVWGKGLYFYHKPCISMILLSPIFVWSICTYITWVCACIHFQNIQHRHRSFSILHFVHSAMRLLSFYFILFCYLCFILVKLYKTNNFGDQKTVRLSPHKKKIRELCTWLYLCINPPRFSP